MNDFVQLHCSASKHYLFLRPGKATTVELYCGICRDFQYSTAFDKLVSKKRRLITDYRIFDPVEKATLVSPSIAQTPQMASDNDHPPMKRALRNRKKMSRGICNMGSTCFMSAVLQILLHTNIIINNPQISEEFLRDFPCQDDKLSSEGGGGCIVCELRNIFFENAVADPM